LIGFVSESHAFACGTMLHANILPALFRAERGKAQATKK
jgi:hypothetical protein